MGTMKVEYAQGLDGPKVIMIILFFIILWCIINYLSSKKSGWNEIAIIFGLKNENIKNIKWFEVIEAWTENCYFYGGLLYFAIRDKNILLKVIPLFSIGYQKLSIPLQHIEYKEWNSIFGIRYYIITFKNIEHLKLKIHKSVIWKSGLASRLGMVKGK
jgi:hypothetical protein